MSQALPVVVDDSFDEGPLNDDLQDPVTAACDVEAAVSKLSISTICYTSSTSNPSIIFFNFNQIFMVLVRHICPMLLL